MTDFMVVIGCILVVSLFLAVVMPRPPRVRRLSLPPPIPPSELVLAMARGQAKAQARAAARKHALAADNRREQAEEIDVARWAVNTHYPAAIKAEVFAIGRLPHAQPDRRLP